MAGADDMRLSAGPVPPPLLYRDGDPLLQSSRRASDKACGASGHNGPMSPRPPDVPGTHPPQPIPPQPSPNPQPAPRPPDPPSPGPMPPGPPTPQPPTPGIGDP